MAAKFEFEDLKDVSSARALLQQGLRANSRAPLLWREVCSLEPRLSSSFSSLVVRKAEYCKRRKAGREPRFEAKRSVLCRPCPLGGRAGHTLLEGEQATPSWRESV